LRLDDRPGRGARWKIYQQATAHASKKAEGGLIAAGSLSDTLSCPMINKGTLSNLASGTLLLTGLLLAATETAVAASDVILSIGLFAFSGGITNALAVKMLFDRIPGLAGSGVIQSRFTEIREEIKRLILDQFFTEENLHRFLREKTAEVDLLSYLKGEDGGNPAVTFVETQWDQLTSPEVLDPLLDEQVEKIFESSALGGLLSLVGKDTILDIVRTFVESFTGSLKKKVLETARDFSANPSTLKLDIERLVADIRREVDSLLERRLEDLSPQDVKRIIEDVIRKHLGWLVVWGNVFGGLIGLGTYLLRDLLP
tara:strand:- start:197 stop:1135 length:939 start_codon:yes stop_codon:yes gene_type:complete